MLLGRTKVCLLRLRAVITGGIVEFSVCSNDYRVQSKLKGGSCLASSEVAEKRLMRKEVSIHNHAGVGKCGLVSTVQRGL